MFKAYVKLIRDYIGIWLHNGYGKELDLYHPKRKGDKRSMKFVFVEYVSSLLDAFGIPVSSNLSS